MSVAAKAYEFITSKLDSGYTIHITTALKTTEVTPKTAAKWAKAGNALFKLSTSGDLMMASGRKFVAIATPSMAFVQINAYA